MSQSYLDKFRSALPTAQGNQILKRLISKRDKGEIRTVDEFKKKLQDLTSELLKERIAPTLKLLEAFPKQEASSERLNEMLERIQDDLEAGFREADTLDDVIAAHHNLIQDVSLKALRYGLNELESQVLLYEFLNRNQFGFDDSVFNTFRATSNLSTGRSDTAASLVFRDPRTNEFIPSIQDAEIDFLGEQLLMATTQFEYLPIKSALWLANENSIRSELDVSFENSNINNILDNTISTFWITSILLSQVRHSGVPMEVCLEFGAPRDVNFVEIEPASPYPMLLTSIDYNDANGIRRTALSVDRHIDAPVRINFGRITSDCIILQFKQNSYKEVQFAKKLGESNFHRAVLDERHLGVDVISVSDDLEEMLSSDYILNTAFGIQETTGSVEKYYEYVLGLDNVRLGFAVFADRSVFASVKKNVTYPGQLAVRTLESRPVQVEGSVEINLETFTYPKRSFLEDQKFYHGAIEYWLVLQSYGEDGFLLTTDTVPLLPLGAQRIYHENLVLTHRSSTSVVNSDQGSLMFFAEEDSSDILVYRNGIALSYGTDWEFVPETGLGANPEITTEDPNSGTRMKRGLQILDTVNLLDIYTVSYTPSISTGYALPDNTSLLNIVDLVGDQSIRLVDGNIVFLENLRNSQVVASLDVYLIVIMRRNSANENFSPALQEYMLVSGSRDTAKFEAD